MNNVSTHLLLFPDKSRGFITDLCQGLTFQLIIKKNRISKLGDFRYPMKGQIPIISLNEDKNAYRLLVTFLHELAHLFVWRDHGKRVNPHGPVWKNAFSQLLQDSIHAGIYPSPLDEYIFEHSQNPKASSHADYMLLNALRFYDDENPSTLLLDIPENQYFKLSNGKVYKKGEKRRTRILCLEVGSRRKYLIHAHAEVISVEQLAS